MRRIVHLSDLHFGRISQGLVGPLVEAVNGLKPDLIVISGDYTQRARHWQFEEAAKEGGWYSEDLIRFLAEGGHLGDRDEVPDWAKGRPVESEARFVLPAGGQNRK